ncbi:MAG: hypothetical protein ACI8X5_000840 [Planctomycetota bacterium]|jgi:hypothetical protein
MAFLSKVTRLTLVLAIVAFSAVQVNAQKTGGDGKKPMTEQEARKAYRAKKEANALEAQEGAKKGAKKGGKEKAGNKNKGNGQDKGNNKGNAKKGNAKKGNNKNKGKQQKPGGKRAGGKGKKASKQLLSEPQIARELTPAEAQDELDNVLCFLVGSQHADGSWGVPVPDDLNELGFAFDSYYAWNQAANALALMALMEAPESPERAYALEGGLDWLCRTRLAHRGSNWDVDSTWPSLYGFVCLVQAAGDERFAKDAIAREKFQRRAMEFYEDLVRRQTPDGGWVYYDDPPFTVKPTWGTSFCTALVLPALFDAEYMGWPVDPEVTLRARSVIERCALPNGAYSYSYNLVMGGHGGMSINQVPGSLGRIQVCNWALARAGDPRVTDDLVREGLEQFFEQHAYLDMVRTRPKPHEGWFANAGYFYFFGHYYAAKAIALLPVEEHEAWHRRLRYHVTKTLSVEGSCSDFMASSYQITAGSSYAALVLAAGLTSSAQE